MEEIKKESARNLNKKVHPLERDSETEVITHARDIEITRRLMPEKRLLGDIKGLVTRVHSRGGISFIQLRDATGQIQLVAERSTLSTQVWERVCKVKQKDRLHVQGYIGFTLPPHNKLSIFVKDLEVLLLHPINERKDINDIIGTTQGRLTTQFFLARLRKRATAFFMKDGFEEFEPTHLSTFREESQIEPLNVIFPGYGANAYLVPSPASQLLEAIYVTASPKVFCISRCFSAVIRDGYTSAESMILCARQFDASLQDMCELTQRVLQEIFKHFHTMPDKILRKWLESEAWPTNKCSWNSVEFPVESPIFHLFSSPQKSEIAKQVIVFRVCWPPNVVIAEGHVEFLEQNFPLGGVTIHLERMIPLLRKVTLGLFQHPA